MTSSAFYELTLEQDGRIVLSLQVAELEVPFQAAVSPPVRAGRALSIHVRRAAARGRLRLQVGGQVHVELPPGRKEWEGGLGGILEGEFGALELLLEEAPAEGGEWGTVARAEVEVEPLPEVAVMHRDMVEELEEAHVGLARDIVSRTTHRAGYTSLSPRAVRPEEDLRRLEEVSARMERALEKIGSQPSSALVLTRRRERWRPGDRCDSRLAGEIASSGKLAQGPGRRVLEVGKVLLRRPRLSTDIGEHRHLREGILEMARGGEALASWCRRAAELYEMEEGRWGEQVFGERFRPRVEACRAMEAEARSLTRRLRGTVERYDFLREAGPPRTPFGPTPIFLGRAAYREAYHALREARRRFGVLVDGADSLRIRYRRFPVLYEYWCFIRVVRALRERLGAGEARGGFSLIDGVYRPELEPGQVFRFRLERGVWVSATYEPEFPPAAARREEELAAALVSAPLRPDVAVEVRREDRPPLILVLDAKSTRSFHREKLWELSDYRSLIHDPRTGWQPVRQVFLLHADRAAPPVTNLSGYLEGRVGRPESSILGAVPCLPGATSHLERVLERFLEVAGGA